MMTTINTTQESSGGEGISGGGVIEVDLPCCGCGYNLRSIQKDKTCPECGKPAVDSLQDDRLLFSHPDWLRRMVIGTNWLLTTTVFSLCLTVLWIVRPLIIVDIDAFVAILRIIHMFNWIVLLIGVFLVTSSEYGRESNQSILRHLARWLLFAAGIFGLILTFAYFALPFVSPTIAIPLYATRHLIHTLGSILLLLYLGSLAGRAGKSGLVLQTRLLPVGYAISLCLALLVSLIHLLVTIDLVSFQSMTFELAGYASSIGTVLSSGLVVWELIFFIMFRRMLVTILKLVKTNTEHYSRNQTPGNYIRDR